MSGAIVNVITVIIGSTIGLIFRKNIPEKLTDCIMKGIALCTLYIGIEGALKGSNTIAMILSIAIGGAVGTALMLEENLEKLGNYFEKKFSSKDGEKVSITEGFVTASLLFCIGSMTTVGSLQAGITGDCSMLYTKSILDLISGCMLSASLGIGVMFASAFVLVFEGGLVLLSSYIAPLLNDVLIAEMVSVGSIMIVGIGLNLLGVTKLKVINYLPALIFSPFMCIITGKILG